MVRIIEASSDIPEIMEVVGISAAEEAIESKCLRTRAILGRCFKEVFEAMKE